MLGTPMKIVAIVQARMGSTRFPDKVMKPLMGEPMIGMLLARLSLSKEIDRIVVATSVDHRNKPLVEYLENLGFDCERGSENDVLGRFLQAARKHGANIIVRITGDCPLVDSELVDECIRAFKTSKVDYLSNVAPPTYPDGLDIEVFSMEALERAGAESQDSFGREHVTPYLRANHSFSKSSIKNEVDLSSLRWTVDEPANLKVVEDVFSHFSPEYPFHLAAGT